MARTNPYVGHSDFYLLDLWQGRAQLKESELQALREEMSQRGLEVDAGPEAAEAYRDAPQVAVGPPCPFCGRPMRDGEVLVQRETGVVAVMAYQGLATHLYFRRKGGDETIVFRHSETRPGAMCEDCGSVIVRGQFAT
jgi:hypothetical protein